MSKFEDVTEDVQEILQEVRKEHFPELRNANIKCLFYNKKKTSEGKLALAYIQKTNDLQRHLTKDEAMSEFGYDYFLYIDKLTWTEGATRDDKVRIIRHELRHTEVNMDKEQPYSLRGHEISDFHDEIALNCDEPRWAEKLVAVAESLYEREKESKKNKG